MHETNTGMAEVNQILRGKVCAVFFVSHNVRNILQIQIIAHHNRRPQCNLIQQLIVCRLPLAAAQKKQPFYAACEHHLKIIMFFLVICVCNGNQGIISKLACLLQKRVDDGRRVCVADVRQKDPYDVRAFCHQVACVCIWRIVQGFDCMQHALTAFRRNRFRGIQHS